MPEIEYFTSLGVGGILAGIMFFFYRKDAINHINQWKGQSGLLMKVVKDNTEAITENTEVARSLRDNLSKK